MLGYLSADVICSEKRTVFRERSSRKNVSFEEQIMSKDKYPSIFSPQMETIVFIILQIFYATRADLKIGVYSRISHSFSWGIFGHVTCLDQSRGSENIWWIIRLDIGRGLWTETESRSINTQKKRPISSHLDRTSLVNKGFTIWLLGNLSCGTRRAVPSGQDGSILAAQVANYSTGFDLLAFPLAELAM